MQLEAIGRAVVDYQVDSWKLFVNALPNLDRRYYEQEEELFERWISAWREAGIPAPTGVLMCCVALYGMLWARLPGPLRWLVALSSALWAAGAVRAGRTSGPH